MKKLIRGPTGPHIQSPPIITNENNQYKIEINVQASPKPTFKWTINRRQIPISNKRFKSQLSGLVPNFKIVMDIADFLLDKDAGTYECLISNSFGSVTALCKLPLKDESTGGIEDSPKPKDVETDKTVEVQRTENDDKYLGKQDDAKQNKGESTNIKHTKPEPDKTELAKTKLTKEVESTKMKVTQAEIRKAKKPEMTVTKSTNIEATKIEAAKAEITKPELAKTKVKTIEPSKTELSKTESAKMGSIKAKSVKTDLKNVEPAKPEVISKKSTNVVSSKTVLAKTEDTKAEESSPDHARTESSKTEQTESKFTKITSSKTVQPKSKVINAKSINAEPSELEPIKTEPSKADMIKIDHSKLKDIKTTTSKVKLSKPSHVRKSPTIESDTEEDVPIPIIKGTGLMNEAIPKFVIYPENKTISKSHANLINARISGNPFPVVKWYKGRTLLRDGIKYHIRENQSKGEISLEITRPKIDDEGLYSIQISNNKGEESSEFNIYLQENETSSLDYRGHLRRRSSTSDHSVSPTRRDSDQDIFGDSSTDRFTDDGRKNSLSNVIPNWPSLRKTKVAQKIKDHWEIPLQNAEVNESDLAVTLTAIFCKPGGTLRWYKNRVEIFQGLKYNFIINGNEKQLIINKLHTDDSGRYICSVNNIETKCWLEVKPSDKQFDFYMLLPVKMEVFRTKTTNLECHVNHPECPVIWMKDNVRLEETNSRFKMHIDNVRCILRIHRTLKEDAGVYTCQIQGYNDKISTCYLYVLEPQWRFKKRLPEQITCNENDEVVLEIELEDLDAECEWFYNDELLNEESDSRYRFEVDNYIRRLHIKNAKPSLDTGKFQCKTGVMSCPTKMTVIPAIRITKHLEDTSIIENENLKLEIELNTKKRQILEWFKDNNRILPNDKIQIDNDKSQYWILIPNASILDAGVYKVRLNKEQEDTCSVNVEREAKKPKLKLSNIPKVISVKAKDTIKLKIPFEGYPSPTIEWHVNDKPLNTEFYTMDMDKECISLEIPNAIRERDSGNYRLKVANNCGSDEVDFKVVVQDVPGRPIGPLIAINTASKCCSLSWKQPLDDGDSKITKYIIEAKDRNKSNWTVIDQLTSDDANLNCNIQRLKDGISYDFRVKAVNNIGSSEYLQCNKPILIEDKCKIPECPSIPVVKSQTPNEITIEWSFSGDDGGAVISSYDVEVKTGLAGAWEKVMTVDNSEKLTATIPNLQESTGYEFRIRARNRVGVGHPSESSGIIKTLALKSSPRIIEKSKTSLELKQGQKLNIYCSFTGVPSPTVTWKFNDSLIDFDNIERTVKTDDSNSTLIIYDVQKTDGGKYTVTVENELGFESANFQVVVKGVPSVPKGPISVSDIFKNKATISWEPPVDDGGSTVTNYVIERMDEESGRWVMATDSISTTSFVMKKLLENHNYKFRVAAENLYGRSDYVYTDEFITARDPYDVPDSPSKPVCVSRDSNYIKIEWNPPVEDGGAPIKGYLIERFNSFSNRWKSLNEHPVEHTHFKDEKVVANQEFVYRIIAVNSAGQSEPSESSDIIPAKPDKVPPLINLELLPSIFGKPEIRVKAGEQLTLKIPIEGLPTPTCSWFKNKECLNNNDRFIVENDSDSSQFQILCCNGSDSGIYTISATNPHGQVEENIKVIVEDVPKPCAGDIQVRNIDTSSLELSWQSPEEDDLYNPILGYKIEYCVYGTDDWQTAERCYPTLRKRITGLDGSQMYKFRISAINNIGQSEAIEAGPISIKFPFDVPGAPQDLHVISVDNTHIEIEWSKPENDGGREIDGYLIEMREKQLPWRRLSKRLTRIKSFAFIEPVAETEYEFRVFAANEAGEGYPSDTTGFIKAENPLSVPGAPSKPTIAAITNDSVELRFRPPTDDGGSTILSYIIEQGSDTSDNWIKVLELPSTEDKCVVTDLHMGDNVRYRIIAVNELGAGEASECTEFVKVEDQPAKPCFSNILLDGGKIEVNAGDEFELILPFTSNPLPFVDFDREDGKYVNNELLECQVLENGTVKISSQSAQRYMDGKYKLTIKNRLGTDTAFVEIIVKDVPSKPKGPLKVSEIDSDCCVLEWKPCEDSGGLPFKHYVVEKRVVGDDNWQVCVPSSKLARCKVDGLQDGTRYEFRILAENDIGLSSPLEIDHSVKIESPFKPPSAPSKPMCVNRSIDYIELDWQKPNRDGGDAISGYVVEYKLWDDDDWKKYNKQPLRACSAKVPNLAQGHLYTFRVAAVNRAGTGDWSQTTDMIEARLPDDIPVLYGFELSDTKEIKFKENVPLDIRIPFTGSPLPSLQITKAGNLLSDSNLMDFKLENGQVVLHFDNPKKQHAGNYTISLTNDSGSANCQLKLVQIGPPEMPEGPLNISEQTTTGCLLSWKCPVGSDEESCANYRIECLDSLHEEWKPLTNSCTSTTYEVYDLMPGRSYKYRVIGENIHGLSLPLESAEFHKAEYPFSTPSIPQSFKCENATDKSVNLQWSRPVSDGGSKIISYKVEMRNTSDSNDWIPITTSEFCDTSLTIDYLKSSKSYDFRVLAQNEAGYSKPAILERVQLAKSICRPSTPPVPDITDITSSSVTLFLHGSSNDGGSPVCEYLVEKRDNVASIWKTADVNQPINQEGPCEIVNLQENLSYEFRVKAKNVANQSNPSEVTKSVKATNKVIDPLAPEVTKHLKDVNVVLQNAVEFEVEYKANPEPIVNWYRDGTKFSPGSRCSIKTTKSKSTLMLNEAFDNDDKAVISCTIKNSEGKAESSCRINIIKLPYINEYPVNQRVHTDETLKFKVPVTSITPFKYSIWKEGDRIGKNDEHIALNQLDDTVTVSFKDCDIDQEGTYTLLFENEAGSTSADFALKVQGVSSVPQGPLKASDITKSSCHLTWRKPIRDGHSKINYYAVEKLDVTDGEPLEWHYCGLFNEPEGIVSNLKENHEYQFRVKAVNASGGSDCLYSDESITVKNPFDIPAHPGKPEVGSVVDSRINLQWKISSDKNPVNGCMIELKSLADDEWTRLPIRYTNNRAAIGNLKDGETYTFRVVAFNDSGESKPSEETNPVLFVDDLLQEPPSITQKLIPQSCVQGSNASFAVAFDGKGNESVKWFKGSSEIYNDQVKYAIKNNDEVCTLTVFSVSPNDQDEYRVKIKNRTGSDVSKADLRVISVPKIKLPDGYDEPISVQENNSLEIKLPIACDDTAEIEWSHNGKVIDDSENRYIIDESDTYASIKLPSVNKDDSGEFTMSVRNKAGAVEVKVAVIVVGVPDVPSNLHVADVSDDHVILTWTAPIDTGGDELTNYVVEIESEDKTFHKIGSCRRTRFSVDNLAPNKSYRFRVRSENINGQSEPTDYVEAVTLPDKNIMRNVMYSSPYGLDQNGNIIRNLEGYRPASYDKCVQDVSEFTTRVKSPEIKKSNVYDYYDIFEEIQSSQFVKAYRAVERNTGKSYMAMYKSSKTPKERKANLEEIEIMSQLDNPHILRLHDCFDNQNDEIILITEFISGNDLQNKLSDRVHGPQNEGEIVSYIRQICEALACMHENNCVHLSLKPESAVFQTRTSDHLKIIDHGLAKKLIPDAEVNVNLDNACFASPELVSNQDVGFYTDMWSVGGLAYFLLTGLYPFGEEHDEVIENIEKCDTKFTNFHRFGNYSEEARDFISNLLTKDPNKRMSAQEALNHPWLQMMHSGSKINPEYYKLLREKTETLQVENNSSRRRSLAIGNLADINRSLHSDSSLHTIVKTSFDRREALPKFILRMNDTSVLEGETAQFRCQVFSSTTPTVKWCRYGKEIKQSLRFVKSSKGTLNLLEIRKCTKEDQGNYEVVVSNQYGEQSMERTLIVQAITEKIEPPQIMQSYFESRRVRIPIETSWVEETRGPSFTYQLRSRVVAAGQPVKLMCTYSGIPTPKITWFKDDQPMLQSGYNYEISDVHGVCNLDYFTVSSEDSGIYKCVAVNSVGVAETYCQLLVTGNTVTIRSRSGSFLEPGTFSSRRSSRSTDITYFEESIRSVISRNK
ncbi:hypothetical protein GJ496_004613 [Pomphorhynchus laevis]|nr:hypothetical protein GJ496_004613 [Pomphorhynchus laevis]